MKKTLISGANGFLGKTLSLQFEATEIVSISRKNATIICDLAKQIPTLPAVNLLIHAAGKAHSVPKTKKENQEFFDVNVTGTKNLLKGLENAPSLPKAIVFISSVAVYGLDKGGVGITENYPLNAQDPYGLSKIQSEQILIEWCARHDIICTILRLPLLVGESPPGNLGSLINGIKKGYYMNIAGGTAKKSMVMAEDVAKYIIPSSQIGGIYNLTDSFHPSFKELSEHIAKQLGKKAPNNISAFFAKFLAKMGDILGDKFPLNSNKLTKIQASLTFDDTKAREAFGWDPQHVLDKFKVV
jgi:nucleoside-diphosphate-sugar epimerase